MILVDVNLLLYAVDDESPFHGPSRTWLVDQLRGPEAVTLSWSIIMSFIRLSTRRSSFSRPLTITQASDIVTTWLDEFEVGILEPGPEHWMLLRDLLARGQATARLVTDAHLAALAMENGAMLCSTDGDFARFKGLRWRNPLDVADH